MASYRWPAGCRGGTFMGMAMASVSDGSDSDSDDGRVMASFLNDGVLGKACASEDDESGCLEPFFYDEAEAAAEAAAAAERRRQQQEEEALKKKLLVQEMKEREAWRKKISKYDHKAGNVLYFRYFLRGPSFDLDQESPLGPKRHTDKIYDNDREVELNLHSSVNILSVKIISSDVGFPIDVYGTIIARDDIDSKCVYLFRRQRHDCQLITSQDDSLILTGPKRGILMIDTIFFEVDLMIKDNQRTRKKTEFSKGLFAINGISGKWQSEKVCSDTLDTRLSTVKMEYAGVKNAVEATVDIRVLEGYFHGEVTASTTNIPYRFMLHDSRACGASVTTYDHDVQLLRRVIAVGLKEKLILTIVNQADCVSTGCSTQKINFTPDVNGSEEAEVACVGVRMLVKVTWSLVVDSPRKISF